MKPARLPKWRRTSVAAALAITTGGVVTSGALHAAAPATQSAAVVGGADAPDVTPQQDIYDLTNAERQRAGVAPVGYDPGLMAAAQAHADDMARTDVLAHVGSDGTTGDERLTRSGFAWTAWGENLAVGYSAPPDVVAAWLNSPDHRAILLNPQYPVMGVGIASANGKVWWTVVLATGDPAAATQPAAAPAPAAPPPAAAAPISADNSSSNSSSNSSNNSSSNSSSNISSNN